MKTANQVPSQAAVDDIPPVGHHGAETIHNIDETVQGLARELPPFYKNPNLVKLYLLMIPGCLVPAITLGFDSAMMNGLQAVPAWLTCKSKLHESQS